MIYKSLIEKLKHKKIFSLLIDPEEYTYQQLIKAIELANAVDVDYIFVGGSFISSIKKFEDTITTLKENTMIPVVIFPGNYMQVSTNADALLLLNLISGRNPEYLIGQHVVAAKSLVESKLEIIPTAYLLIENGKTTSVEYVSNTKPIPADKHELIVSTSIAGELMGNKLVYLESGSGALNHVHTDIIKKVKSNINIPLIVGGGIKNKETLENVYQAGADMVVVGNAIEQQPELLYSFFSL